MSDDFVNARRELFERFVEELPGSLSELGEVFGVTPPSRVYEEPEKYIDDMQRLADECQRESWAPEDANWVLSKAIYFAGEILRRRLNANWALCEVPGSDYYLRHVLQYDVANGDKSLFIDPSVIAARLLSEGDFKLAEALVNISVPP